MTGRVRNHLRCRLRASCSAGWPSSQLCVCVFVCVCVCVCVGVCMCVCVCEFGVQGE